MVVNTPSGEAASDIRIGFRTRWLTKQRLRFMRQLGVEDVFVDAISPGYEADAYPDNMDMDNKNHLKLAPDVIPSVEQLREAKVRVENAGLQFAGIHSLHYGMYDDIMFDRDGKERQIEAISTLIDRLGETGIDTLGYQWNPRGLVPMRTELKTVTRGDAITSAFDESELGDIDTQLDRTYTVAECWEYYKQFLEAVLPHAEASGVRMALHPADPPTYQKLGGVPRLFGTVESFNRAMEIVPSEAHGIKLCLGCFSEMGENVPNVIRHFGNDIAFVHFRDVTGTVPSFTETFLDEGNFDEFDAIMALDEVNFTGSVLLDHVPGLEGDSEWRHRSRAYGTGYLRCLINCIERL